MNREVIKLSMTRNEADKVAFVLMSALKTVTMLDQERAVATDAANELFAQLGYDDHRITPEGKRTGTTV